VAASERAGSRAARPTTTSSHLNLISSLPRFFYGGCGMLAGARSGDARIPTSRMDDGLLRPHGSLSHARFLPFFRLLSRLYE